MKGRSRNNEMGWTDLHRATVGPLLLSLCACAGVKNVAVDPPVSCPGETVSVRWQATGSTRLFQVPLEPGQSDQCIDTLVAGRTPTPLQSQGQNRLPIQQSTVFYIEARGLLGKPAHRCATAFVNEALPLAGISQCSGPRHVGIGVARPSDSQWSAHAKVGSVKNTNDVTVTVSHGGVTETLAPGATSAAFASSDPNGGWVIDYVLPVGPDCGQSGAQLPASLSILVLPHCGTDR
jgi:hypothetical protein